MRTVEGIASPSGAPPGPAGDGRPPREPVRVLHAGLRGRDGGRAPERRPRPRPALAGTSAAARATRPSCGPPRRRRRAGAGLDARRGPGRVRRPAGTPAGAARAARRGLAGRAAQRRGRDPPRLRGAGPGAALASGRDRGRRRLGAPRSRPPVAEPPARVEDGAAFLPASEDEAARLYAANPDATLVAGATDVGPLGDQGAARPCRGRFLHRARDWPGSSARATGSASAPAPP